MQKRNPQSFLESLHIRPIKYNQENFYSLEIFVLISKGIVMVDNAHEDVETQTALLDLDTEKIEILCDFKFDNHDCLAIKLAENSDIPVELPD